MTQNQIFGSAKWICANRDGDAALVIRKRFDYSGKKAILRLIGLGTFEAYINGKRVENDLFLPMNTEYEKTEFPWGEQLFGYRIYVTEYDVSSYLKEGENTLVMHVGTGWYNGMWFGIKKIYGGRKAIFSLSIDGEENTVVSDGTEEWVPSYVTESDLHLGETHDYTAWDDAYLSGLGEGWMPVALAKPVESDYGYTNCPPDRVMQVVTPTVVLEGEGYKIYDAGKNTSGYPLIRTRAGYTGEIKIKLAESLVGDDLDPEHIHDQHFNIKCDGKERLVHICFTWLGFRYFKVEGECDAESVHYIYSDLEKTSSFETDDEVLNWFHDTYVHTQLTNMHRGIPSDCPHIERLGYTGDGQVTCKSVMMTLGTKDFYEKWILDISDCQDVLSGRVQYTAPYFYAGGGPGGYGGGIVIIPYEYYKAYGDDTLLRKLYPQMLRHFDFLDEHSDFGLVTSYKENVWCLGDWVTPVQWTLPTPFVNTCFYVKTMQMLIEIAKIIGKDEDIPALEERIALRKKAINTAYFNSFFADDTYCANTQGAGAFALNIGLGTDITKQKFISFYEKNPVFDTGIFGTELVTRKLFEYGRGDIALKMLTHNDTHGFGRWREEGYTTFREYWGNDYCRSYNHPMFGGAIACLYEFVLGIQQESDSAGYEKIVISPAVLEGINKARGHLTTPKGKVAVEYERAGGKTKYTVSIPEGAVARIAIAGVEEQTVGGGIYNFEV